MRKESLVKKGYDKMALRYHRQRNIYSSKMLLNKFAKNMKNGSRVIDLGCGAGVPVTRYLVKKGYKVTGIDISEGMIKLAKKNVLGAKFLRMDMTKLRLKQNSFDGAVSFYAIIHVPREKHLKLYKTLRRILKPDAVILVNASGTDDLKEDVQAYLGVKMFWSHYSPDKTLEIIKSVGFEIVWDKVLKIGGEKQFWVLAKNRKSSRE